MNRGTKILRVGLQAFGLAACLAGFAFGADAAAEKSKQSAPPPADEASKSRPDQDKAKQRKAAAKAAVHSPDQDDKKNGKKSGKKPEEKSRSGFEAQESAALALVGDHHPELLDLLEQLKADNSKRYQQAIGELYRASQRLSDRQAKDPARYALELKAWQLDSQARLLAAKLTMDADPELEARLKAVLVDREDVAVALLEMDRIRLADRLQQVERQLEKRRAQRDSRANQAFEQLTRRSGKARPKNQAPKDAQAAKNAKPEKNKREKADAARLPADQDQPSQDSANSPPAAVNP